MTGRERDGLAGLAQAAQPPQRAAASRHHETLVDGARRGIVAVPVDQGLFEKRDRTDRALQNGSSFCLRPLPRTAYKHLL